ncbi:unnamed protein product [Clavelina lepadiformis]|uniref:Complex III assembly factor LYRM7 n=1 Tax=Clavelina lepadiformis TaxID=159417 RepID=A0ABP0EV84_CLALP
MSGTNALRSKVLAAFKDLHKARLQTFRGDKKALDAGRLEINQNFRKNKDITDPVKIEELITVAQDSANILRKHVLQLEQIEENKFRANITKDISFIDNTMYKDIPEEELLKHKKNKRAKCRPEKD